MRICLCTSSQITRSYFEALLLGRAELAVAASVSEAPSCEVLVTDLDTAPMPTRIPQGCRHLTIGSSGTPSLLRPFTDRELLDRLLLSEKNRGEPTLSAEPPRLVINGEEMALSKIEHTLLSLLLSGEQVLYGELISAAWADEGADINLLRVTVSHLRKKLAPFGIRIESTRGSYRLRK